VSGERPEGTLVDAEKRERLPEPRRRLLRHEDRRSLAGHVPVPLDRREPRGTLDRPVVVVVPQRYQRHGMLQARLRDRPVRSDEPFDLPVAVAPDASGEGLGDPGFVSDRLLDHVPAPQRDPERVDERRVPELEHVGLLWGVGGEFVERLVGPDPDLSRHRHRLVRLPVRKHRPAPNRPLRNGEERRV
jgi:hypothetical protein